MQTVNIKPDDFSAARRASNLSLDDAAELCGMVRQTYASRESRPSDFKLGELVAIYGNLNDPGKRIMRDAIGSLFLP